MATGTQSTTAHVFVHIFRSRNFLCRKRFSHIPSEDGSLMVARLQFLERFILPDGTTVLTSEDFAADIQWTLCNPAHSSHGLGCIAVYTTCTRCSLCSHVFFRQTDVRKDSLCPEPFFIVADSLRALVNRGATVGDTLPSHTEQGPTRHLLFNPSM